MWVSLAPTVGSGDDTPIQTGNRGRDLRTLARSSDLSGNFCLGRLERLERLEWPEWLVWFGWLGFTATGASPWYCCDRLVHWRQRGQDTSK